MTRLPFRIPSLALVAVLSILLAAPTVFAQTAAPPPGGITVTGVGTASAPAETAIVVLSIGSDPYMYAGDMGMAPMPIEPSTPVVTATDIARPIVDALVTAGVPAADIEVISNPYAGYGPYGAPLNVMVRFQVANPTVEGLQALIDPAIQAAAGARLAINMTSVVYGVADCTALLQQARASAVADARDTAALQATALDVTLGDVVASRDTPAALISGPWTGPMPLNSCTPGAGDLASLSTYGGPIFDPQQPAEVSVQTAIEITFDFAR